MAQNTSAGGSSKTAARGTARNSATGALAYRNQRVPRGPEKHGVAPALKIPPLEMKRLDVFDPVSPRSRDRNPIAQTADNLLKYRNPDPPAPPSPEESNRARPVVIAALLVLGKNGFQTHPDNPAQQSDNSTALGLSTRSPTS
jgi:hypothetical protein